MFAFSMPLVIVLGMEDYGKPLQLQHRYRTVSAAHLFCSLITTFTQFSCFLFVTKQSVLTAVRPFRAKHRDYVLITAVHLLTNSLYSVVDVFQLHLFMVK
jgi:hypothetical protein